MSMSVTDVERSIKDFVSSRTGEVVYMDVSVQDTVTIRHLSRSGSTSLAIFWVNVFQHSNNYPPKKYRYKISSNKQGGAGKVVLEVDNVKLTVSMTTGTVLIHGNHVLEWFLDKFIRMLWQCSSDDIQERAGHENMILGKSAESKKESRKPDVKETQSNIKKISSRNVMYGIPDISQPDTNVGAKELMELEMWNDDIMNIQLNKLQRGCMQSGSSYVYVLWKSLLKRWFSDASCTVYMASPRLDTTQLVTLCRLVLDNRLSATLETFFVQPICDGDSRLPMVKRTALKSFDQKDQMFLEYNIFSSIFSPASQFNSSFIAAVKDGQAEVLATSAGFHRDHFGQESKEFVIFQKMSAEDFKMDYLSPINCSH